MKSAKLNKRISLLLMIIFPLVAGLPGCSNVRKITLNPISTLEPISSPTISISRTPPVTPRATLTYTPLPTMTLTPIPTLDPAEAKSRLRQLLMKSEPCQLPCLWGVTPDQTTLDEAKIIFNSLGLKLNLTLQNKEKKFYASDFGLESGLGVSIVFRVQDGLIDSINIGIGLTNVRNPPKQREWLAFSPETILAQYGIPTRVEFLAALPPCGSSPCQISYSMLMYFDSSNLVVEYDSKLIEDKKIVNICPAIDNYDGVRVWLGKNAENVPTKQGVSLDNATSLNLEQFYTSMLQNLEITCFDLSRDSLMQGR